MNLERTQIRQAIARVLTFKLDDDTFTSVAVGPVVGHTEPPTVHYIPCEEAAVVWHERYDPTTGAAYDCRVDDGKELAAEVIADQIREHVGNDGSEAIPVKFDGPEEDVDDIIDCLTVNDAFYEIER